VLNIGRWSWCATNETKTSSHARTETHGRVDLMARARLIKPEFWSSPTLAAVSIQAEHLFIGLWNFADDYGVLVDSPRRIYGDIFPLREEVTLEQVKGWIGELLAAGVIFRASVAKQKYLIVTSWNEHQTVHHPSKQRCLSEKDLREARESLGRVSGESREVLRLEVEVEVQEEVQEEVQALCDPGGSARVGKNEDSSLTMKTAKGKTLNGKQFEGFSRFWETFGDKRARAAAADSWHNLKPDEATTEAIVDGAKRYSACRSRMIEDGKTPKMAQGWLTDRRWEDEDDPIPSAKMQRPDDW